MPNIILSEQPKTEDVYEQNHEGGDTLRRYGNALFAHYQNSAQGNAARNRYARAVVHSGRGGFKRHNRHTYNYKRKEKRH